VGAIRGGSRSYVLSGPQGGPCPHDQPRRGGIAFEREHPTGIYFGAGGGWHFAPTWAAQAELISYDKDELVLTMGLRAQF
jgi:hypothetical protein